MVNVFLKLQKICFTQADKQHKANDCCMVSVMVSLGRLTNLNMIQHVKIKNNPSAYCSKLSSLSSNWDEYL